MFIAGRIEGNDLNGAAAVSVTLLLISLAVLAAISGLSHWRSRHER